MPFNTVFSANVCGYVCTKYVIKQVGTGGYVFDEFDNCKNKFENKFP
jgi:hypothetical protein